MLAFLLMAAPSMADDHPAAIQYGTCVHCHGAHAEGRPELGTPRLGDLDAPYILRQLQALNDGTRGGHPDDPTAKPMVAIATGLSSDERMSELADYVAAIEAPTYARGPSVRGGARAYAPCATCHGADARGIPAMNAPGLLYQQPNYLKAQLVKFRDGLRGGPDDGPFAQQMAAMVGASSDEEIDRVVGHIAALRPTPRPLNNPPVTLSREEGLAAFEQIYAAVSHPRCTNCHPAGDAPLHTDESIPHDFGVTRFSPLQGLHCSTCHAQSPVGDGLAPQPPADPIWSIAPAEMVFEGRTPSQICAQLKNPETNGRRGFNDLTQHLEEDHLLQTSWHSGRTPPPMSHPELVEAFATWGSAGGPCPDPSIHEQE
ncbi:MAG: c-type cytochrome [Myxococcales bacterium]|nr:c-type cytochrome [Myxococcales bacterium]